MHSIHEDSQVVGQHDLFQQADEKTLCSVSNMLWYDDSRSLQLRQELHGSDDGTRHQLWKEGHEQGKVHELFRGL